MSGVPTLTPPRRFGIGRLFPLALLIPAACLAALGCKDALSGFGAGARARTTVDQFYGSLASRHLGNVHASDIALVISRLLVAGEGLDERTARAELAAVAPRTSAALGVAFSLDTLRPVVLQDGTTLVSLAIGVHSDQLHARYPAFGD